MNAPKLMTVESCAAEVQRYFDAIANDPRVKKVLSDALTHWLFYGEYPSKGEVRELMNKHGLIPQTEPA